MCGAVGVYIVIVKVKENGSLVVIHVFCCTMHIGTQRNIVLLMWKLVDMFLVFVQFLFYFFGCVGFDNYYI